MTKEYKIKTLLEYAGYSRVLISRTTIRYGDTLCVTSQPPHMRGSVTVCDPTSTVDAFKGYLKTVFTETSDPLGDDLTAYLTFLCGTLATHHRVRAINAHDLFFCDVDSMVDSFLQHKRLGDYNPNT